jgi:sialic acid synthase SpsE
MIKTFTALNSRNRWHKIANNNKTYFIADIAANHDGVLEKAIDLIHLAKKSGANAVKFQHFSAETIVSDKSFRTLNNKLSHQASWKKSVFEVYRQASINIKWTKVLKETCDKVKIDFFTSPYSLDLVDHADPYVFAYKIGSGDITWIDIIRHIAKKNKPVFIATGASNLKDVSRAVNTIKKYNNKKICIMQCNTNYTSKLDNFNYINLNVLKTYKKKFPDCLLGLSDHTPGHSTVLGAIAFGARVIEKHFTISNNGVGPDHKFSMTPKTWKEMVDRSRELELALGTDLKKIEKNELDTVVVQRRSLHVNKFIKKGHKINKSDIICLRPCLKGSINPYDFKLIKNKVLKKDLEKGEIIFWKDLR